MPTVISPILKAKFTLTPAHGIRIMRLPRKTILKIHQPDEFVPYQSMTYLAFYKDDERGGKSFEAWSGTFA